MSSLESVKAFLKNDTNASFISGGVAGAVSRTVVSPFERAKILLQIQGPGSGNYQGMFSTILKMYKEEGWKGLYRGNGLNCIRIFPYSAIQFAVFEKCKHFFLVPGQKELRTDQRMVAGLFGGVTSVAATYPLDLIRARLTVQTASLSKLNKSKVGLEQKLPGVMSVFKDVYRNEGGIRGLYRGIWPTTLGVAPYVAINFTLYEKLREYIPNNNPMWKLSAGAFSSFVGGVMIYPLDLLRKRFQVASMGEGELGFRYKSVAHALTSIVKKEGFGGLYKGMTANLYKIVPSMAVSWLCYDSLKAWIGEL